MNISFDIINRSKNYLIEQYRGTDVESFVDSSNSILTDKHKEYLESIDGYTDIQKQGISLDFYGSIINVLRKTLEPDVNYFNRIVQRITQIRATGTLQNSLDILEGVIGFQVTNFLESFPGIVLWFVAGNGLIDAIPVFLRSARPAGVRYDIVYAIDEANVLSYTSGGSRNRKLTFLDDQGSVILQGGTYSRLYT